MAATSTTRATIRWSSSARCGTARRRINASYAADQSSRLTIGINEKRPTTQHPLCVRRQHGAPGEGGGASCEGNSESGERPLRLIGADKPSSHRERWEHIRSSIAPPARIAHLDADMTALRATQRPEHCVNRRVDAEQDHEGHDRDCSMFPAWIPVRVFAAAVNVHPRCGSAKLSKCPSRHYNSPSEHVA